MRTYNIVQLPVTSAVPGIELRGGAKQLWSCKDHEVILVGPSETGKTYGALQKLDTLCWKYPNLQTAIVRKTYKSTVASVMQTYLNKIINPAAGVEIFGGERPEHVTYPTGSKIWIGGMDNADKILSSERDFIYVNQAEELTLSDWETLSTRTTGRAGNSPYSQIFGDCNPAGSLHWIRKRGDLTLLLSHHQDNPMLYDREGNLTDQGKRTMAVLQSLTGVRYRRLYLGEWATAEGVVYDNFSHDTHVREMGSELFTRWQLWLDEGYTNPAVILLVGIDGDGCKHIFSEFYERGKLQSAVVAECLALAEDHPCETVIVDAAAAGLIADLIDAGLPAIGAKGRVLDGIQTVQNALKVQGDGKPRLTVDPSCVNTINEFESYIWKPEKDEPLKENDHAMDAIRYGHSVDALWWIV